MAFYIFSNFYGDIKWYLNMSSILFYLTFIFVKDKYFLWDKFNVFFSRYFHSIILLKIIRKWNVSHTKLYREGLVNLFYSAAVLLFSWPSYEPGAICSQSECVERNKGYCRLLNFRHGYIISTPLVLFFDIVPNNLFR